jgi:steroid delta-isomerase-like uncharacterized protein
MSASQNKALVRRYYEEMWNRWDLALADELIAEGVNFRGSLGTVVQGREGFKEYVRAVRRAFPDFYNRVEDLIAEDDTVVARLTYTGTHRGELFGIDPTGRHVSYAGMAIFRVTGGQVIKGWVLGDLHGLVGQLGGEEGKGRGASPARTPGIVGTTLTGRWVQLEPLAEIHREGLRRAADDERIWTHMTVVARGPGFEAWFEDALAEQQAGKRVPFVVRRRGDDRLVGSTSFLSPNVRHRRVEIGSTWYSPDVWSSAVNPESKLLLLTHAFEALGMNRVEFVTDVRNERSQAAIARLGAVREGVCRSHMITQGGRVRDSVLFSITGAEWPGVKERLGERLAAAGPA